MSRLDAFDVADRSPVRRCSTATARSMATRRRATPSRRAARRTAGLDACFNQSCPSEGSIAVTSTCGPNCEISNATAKDGDDCVPGTITNTNAVDTVTWPPPKHGNCAQITVFLNCVCPERGDSDGPAVVHGL